MAGNVSIEAISLEIQPSSTALIVVDIQNFTVAMETHPVPATTVLTNVVTLAQACRAVGILVAIIRVGHDAAGVPSLDPITDSRFSGFAFPRGAKEIPAELGPQAGDIVVDKYGWGAFHGTSLDTHLRRRGISTLIVGGLVTNIGVDTTMRQGHDRGYHQILASDATAAMTTEEHRYIIETIAPRIARVRSTQDILAALRDASARGTPLR